MVADSPSSISIDVVGERYRLGEVIGRGGMSSVYRAKDENLGRDVALKLFAPRATDAGELKRQEAEIRLLATLNHPSLVTLFDAGVDTRIPDEPRPFLTMELVEGQDLRSRIRHSAVPLDELAVIGAGIADALAYVHGLGIIHRDIKPGNILLVQTRPGEPLRAKVTDFGIARIADSTRLTVTGAMVGTAAYLSPEQATGSPLSPATDVYSLGLVLLECVKKAMEYPGSAVESAVARLHRAPSIPQDLPAGWADLIRSMTSLEPRERPTAADIETALRQALVSPTFSPGNLAPETTRVLPARPFRAPSVTADSPSPNLPARPTTGHPNGNDFAHANQSLPGPYAPQPTTPRGTYPRRPSRAGERLRLPVAILTLLALAGGAAAFTASQAPPSTSGITPYPAVTGALGDHLQELQNSVQP
ncbi:serine/threonine-protein kinase [Pseudarthrobacter sulfonivorans]|uniref:serine/threonine-protein kinase n=1 Tax=Pseudarthrobacter sulfonivorans TaxID=121292 RepID=UPI0028595363|nr:serine/threonine-protein kinase [Pseudarthrobacter sulfonivorans]MDR6414092.1 serine/threonine protein kinase [Pseudarthrobacter sulfonivorans]